MAAEKKFPISLIVKAIDQASGPITAMTASLKSQLGPFNDLSDKWSKFGKAANFGAIANVGGALKNVGSEAFGVAARLGGLTLGAGLAFGAIVKGATEAGDKLGEVASRTGTTVDFFASMQHAAAQSDVSAEQFTDSMDKLNKSLGDMKVGKGGEFLKFLDEVSPAFAKQMKGAKGTEEAMGLLTDAFSKIDDPSKRATLAAHAFGKSNLQMGEFLRTGSAAIQEQQRAFMRLAGPQEEFARLSGVFDNSMRETGTAFEGVRNSMVTGFLPALTKLSEVTTKFLAEHREGLATWAEKTGRAITAWVDGGGMTRLAETLSKVGDGVMKVVDFLGPMGVAAVAAGVAFAPLILSVGSLGVALVTAAPALIALGGLLLPLAPAAIAVTGAALGLAAAGYKIYTAWDEVNAKLEEFGDTFRWAIVDGWKEVRPVIAAMALVPGFGGAGLALAAGDSVSGQTSAAIQAHTGQSVEAIRARSADAARPVNQSVSTQNNVSVSFDNLPAGARVSQSGDSSVDLSVGYSVRP